MEASFPAHSVPDTVAVDTVGATVAVAMVNTVSVRHATRCTVHDVPVVSVPIVMIVSVTVHMVSVLMGLLLYA